MSNACERAARAAVRARFPALGDARPAVRRAGRDRVYTFRGAVEVDGGRRMAQIVRVTVSEAGRVLRVRASK